MKKFICLSLSALIFLYGSINAYGNTFNKSGWKEYEKLLSPDNFAGMLCDADRSGRITAADARQCLRFSVKLDTPSDIQRLCADADSNGIISAYDARKILRISCGLDTLPAVIYTVNAGNNFSIGPFDPVSQYVWRLEGTALTHKITEIKPDNIYIYGDSPSYIYTFTCKEKGSFGLLFSLKDCATGKSTADYKVIINVV